MFVESSYYHDCNAFRATRLVDLTVMIRSKDTGCMKSNEFLRGKYWKDTKQLPHFLGLGLELFVLRGNLSGTKKSSGCYVTIHMRCKIKYGHDFLDLWYAPSASLEFRRPTAVTALPLATSANICVPVRPTTPTRQINPPGSNAWHAWLQQ